MKQALLIVGIIALTFLVYSCSSPEGEVKNIPPGKLVMIKGPAGAAILVGACTEESFKREESDWVIEGQVTRVAVKEVTQGDIFTNVDFSIEGYLKGENIGDGIVLQIPGGCIGERCLMVEDQPGFEEGQNYRLYVYQDSEGEYRLVCAFMGVVEI